jgi:hypothetical protein
MRLLLQFCALLLVALSTMAVKNSNSRRRLRSTRKLQKQVSKLSSTPGSAKKTKKVDFEVEIDEFETAFEDELTNWL